MKERRVTRSITIKTVSHGTLTHCGFENSGKETVVIGDLRIPTRDFVSFAAHIIAGGGINSWGKDIPEFVKDNVDYINQRIARQGQ